MQDSFKETFNLAQQKKNGKKHGEEAVMAKNEVNVNNKMLDGISG